MKFYSQIVNRFQQQFTQMKFVIVKAISNELLDLKRLAKEVNTEAKIHARVGILKL